MREYILKISGREYKANVKELTAETARIVVNDQEYTVELVQLGRKKIAAADIQQGAAGTAPRPSTAPMPTAPKSPQAGTGEGVTTPLPGLILQVMVKEGDTVQSGQNVILMEAMKMENHIQAPYTGTVKRVFVKNGDDVAEGDTLLEISRPEMTTL